MGTRPRGQAVTRRSEHKPWHGLGDAIVLASVGVVLVVLGVALLSISAALIVFGFTLIGAAVLVLFVRAEAARRPS